MNDPTFDTVDGDLIKMGKNGDFDVIIHGCNCFHTMGAGIAGRIRHHWPSAYLADRNLSGYGDTGKLGTYTSIISSINGHELNIVNAYTQYGFGAGGKGGRDVNYESIARVFALIKRDFHGKSIGYPMIGAGLAGGNWKIIHTIISEELKGENHTLVVYNA